MHPRRVPYKLPRPSPAPAVPVTMNEHDDARIGATFPCGCQRPLVLSPSPSEKHRDPPIFLTEGSGLRCQRCKSKCVFSCQGLSGAAWAPVSGEPAQAAAAEGWWVQVPEAQRLLVGRTQSLRHSSRAVLSGSTVCPGPAPRQPCLLPVARCPVPSSPPSAPSLSAAPAQRLGSRPSGTDCGPSLAALSYSSLMGSSRNKIAYPHFTGGETKAYQQRDLARPTDCGQRGQHMSSFLPDPKSSWQFV